jgi:hypothetical protein
MDRLLPALLLCVASAGVAACKTTRAETPVERPNLEVPPPPPRVIEPALVVEAPPPDPVAESPTAPAGGSPPRPRPPRDPGTTKPEVKPEVPIETPLPPPITAPAAPQQLRTPGLASGPETIGEIRAILDRTQGVLDKIDYQRLTKPRQNSYDTAKRFHAEGEKELKAANYVLAKELAEKAERLAIELQTR